MSHWIFLLLASPRSQLRHSQPPMSTTLSPDSMYSLAPVRLADKRLNLWLMTEVNPTQQSLSPLSESEGWVGICYIFCPQEGLLWYKVIQNFLFLYKRNKQFRRKSACWTTDRYRPKTAESLCGQTCLKDWTVYIACLKHIRHGWSSLQWQNFGTREATQKKW